MFWGLFLSSVMVQFTGCQDGSSSGKAVGVKFTPGAATKSAGQKVDAKGQPINADGTPQTPDQRNAKLIALHQIVLGQAQQFFAESWKLAMSSKEASKASVFSQALDEIKKVANEDGSVKAKEVGHKCSEKENKITIKPKSGTSAEILDLAIVDCNDKVTGWIMRSVQTNPGMMEMHFNPVQLNKGAGDRLAARGLQDRHLTIKCLLNFLGTGRVSMLSCTHLGQTLDAEHNMEFEYFTYNLNGANLLDFKSIQYTSDFTTKNPKECDRVVTVPKEGKIAVHEICPPPMEAKPAQELPALPATNPLVAPVGKDVDGRELAKPQDTQTLDTQAAPPSAMVEPTAVAPAGKPTAPVPVKTKKAPSKDERDNQPPPVAVDDAQPELAPANAPEVKDVVQ